VSGFANLDPALAINPDAERVRRFLDLDASEPVVFVNLHRYRERALYPGRLRRPNPHVSGREAYHRYVQRSGAPLPAAGRRAIPDRCTGRSHVDRRRRLARCVIASYPSRKAALELPALQGYADIAVHRQAGLERR
jgi:uncharacterized protein (DUF1330 family)